MCEQNEMNFKIIFILIYKTFISAFIFTFSEWVEEKLEDLTET